MAFICKDCYLKEAKNQKERDERLEMWLAWLKSYGPCETCHKTADCIDD